MTKKRQIIYWLTVFVIVGFLGLGGYHYLTRGIRVSITNNTNSVLKDVEISYTGGVVHITKLRPNELYSTYINPTGESHLELKWLEPSGKKHFHRIDVYFECDYTGSVTITVDPGYKVSWSDKIRSAPLGKL